MSFTLEQASRLYGVPLTDYEQLDYDEHGHTGARGAGLLVSSGAGMMMSVMDCCPSLRWCVDVDGLRDRRRVRVADFILCAERSASPLAICGWFSITDPRELVGAVRGLTRPAIVYLGNLRLGLPGEVDSFREFVSAIDAAAIDSMSQPVQQ